MTASRLARLATICLLAVAALLPAAGCGGKKKKAGPTIEQQIEKAEAEGTPDRQAAALLKVARKQLALGDKTGAKTTVKKVYDKLMGEEEGDANLFSPRLVETAIVLVQVGDKKTARDALEEATTLGEKIEDASRKAKVYADSGALFGDKKKGLGDAKQAKEWLTKAQEVAESVEERFRAEALGAVALGYSNSGLAKEAAAMVDKLKDCAAALEEPRAKAEALAAAASVQVRSGKKDDATALLTEATAAAKGVERTESRAYALLAVAEALVANGDKKTAKALLKDAEKSADKVSDAELRQVALEKVRGLAKEIDKK